MRTASRKVPMRRLLEPVIATPASERERRDPPEREAPEEQGHAHRHHDDDEHEDVERDAGPVHRVLQHGTMTGYVALGWISSYGGPLVAMPHIFAFGGPAVEPDDIGTRFATIADAYPRALQRELTPSYVRRGRACSRPRWRGRPG